MKIHLLGYGRDTFPDHLPNGECIKFSVGVRLPFEKGKEDWGLKGETPSQAVKGEPKGYHLAKLAITRQHYNTIVAITCQG